MTEHSVTDYLQDRLPNWHEQLLFAEELNECMVAGCTAYVYWYMRAHWGFISTGEAKYGTANKTKNRMLPRAYVMSHFSKHVTGSTRIYANAIGYTPQTEAAFETSAYVKGDSLIVMAIDTTQNEKELVLKLPFKVGRGTHILSTGNKTSELCQELPIDISEPVQELTVTIPGRSLSTLIFIKDDGTAIRDVQGETSASGRADAGWYDLQGRRIRTPKGLSIERRTDGTSKKVLVK